jgi:hypothetical protein
MNRGCVLRRLSGLGLLVALLAALLASRSFIRISTVDRNGDGRPDLWQYYNAAGTLLAVETDTNFDGQSDSDQQFVDGRLVRLERDRNFDGRVDLIEEFDPMSREPIRSTVDIDFDGRADLLTLFADGRPVFSQRTATLPQTSRAAAVERGGATGNGMLALDDPFSSTARLRTAALRATPLVADADGTSFPAATGVLWPQDEPTQIVWWGYASFVGSHRLAIRSPRGPPASFLVS